MKDLHKIIKLPESETLSTEIDDELLIKASETLAGILAEATRFNARASSEEAASVESVCSFIDSDEVQKRKLLSYCIDFKDPTVCSGQVSQGEMICQHAYLKQNELTMLHKFVKRHQNDISFGDTVYKIMDKHGMTAPQVYRNALLRRQDFARVTDSRCKNVTRKMTWQIVIGLHCSLEEADDVLFSAGYIRRNTRMDLTMQYFIEHENYDIEAIDAALSELGLQTFTCE